MGNYTQFLKQLSPQLLDQAVVENDKLFLPFSLTDLLTSEMQHTMKPVLHFWQFDQTVILGMKDARVPFLAAAVKNLTKTQHSVMLRSSGGLGIVTDSGVLNVSFILPNTSEYPLEITQAYRLIATIVADSFADFDVKIETKEITDSYCPGEYDLSIKNKKFAGLAQRRVKQGTSIMLYLSVFGPQAERGKIMKQFYKDGLAADFGTNGYPPVNPDSMGNLNELLQTNLTIEEVKERISKAFQHYFDTTFSEITFENTITADSLKEKLALQFKKMTNRNEIITEILRG